MLRTHLLPLGLLFTGLLVLVGCGSKSPAATTITGIVWYRGEPLPGGLIVFSPDSDRGNNGPPAKCAIAADGTFTLAPETSAGWYRVAVAPLPSEGISVPSVANPYPGPPSRYRNPNLSGLSGEIKPGSTNTFEFHLEDS